MKPDDQTPEPEHDRGRPADPGRKPIPFKIDGKDYETTDTRQQAKDLLDLAGLPADGYDLARHRGQGQVENFDDNAEVHIRPGDRFITKRQAGTVA